eukprot:g4997.t1
MLDEILRSETRKTESPNQAPEEEKSNEQDAEEEEEEEEVEDNTKTTKSKARCQGRYWPVPEHVRELGISYDTAREMKNKSKLDDTVIDEQIMHVMRALMGQRADRDGKPEFGFTLKGDRDVISIQERKSKPYSNKEHIGQYEIVKGATVQPGQSDDESKEDTDSEDDKDEEEEGGKGKKKIQKGKKSTLEQKTNQHPEEKEQEKTLKKEKPREPKTRKEKQETQKEKTIKGGAESTSKREREKGKQDAEEEPTVQTEEGQEQVDLTIVSTSASLSAVPKKGMGVLLESPRKGEDGTEAKKKVRGQ